MKVYDNTHTNHVSAYQYYVKGSALYVDAGTLTPLYADEVVEAFPVGILVVEGNTTTLATALNVAGGGYTLTVGSKTFTVPAKSAG